MRRVSVFATTNHTHTHRVRERIKKKKLADDDSEFTTIFLFFFLFFSPFNAVQNPRDCSRTYAARQYKNTVYYNVYYIVYNTRRACFYFFFFFFSRLKAPPRVYVVRPKPKTFLYVTQSTRANRSVTIYTYDVHIIYTHTHTESKPRVYRVRKNIQWTFPGKQCRVLMVYIKQASC